MFYRSWATFFAVPALLLGAEAYSPKSASYSSPSSINRRDFGVAALATPAFLGLLANPSSSAWAFDGSGSSALAGYNPSTKAEKVKAYKQRVIADVQDFNVLGDAITKGETEGRSWVNFFIQFPRKEPDELGRSYAALVDLRGLPTKKKYEYEGGDGLLLATSFTKAGKPPENTPAVKSWNKLFKTFDAIEAAGKKGDVAKAKTEWENTKVLLEAYLRDVELPGDLKDPIYQ